MNGKGKCQSFIVMHNKVLVQPQATFKMRRLLLSAFIKLMGHGTLMKAEFLSKFIANAL